MGKKVLVTGATGRIGSIIVKKLIERGFEVRAFALPGDPFISRYSDTNCETYYGNLTEENDVKEALKGCQFVVHMAALMAKPAEMDDTTYMEINVKSTWNITRCAMKAGIKRLVYGSSDAYYPVGTEHSYPILETAVSTPRCGCNYLYSLTKRINEEIVWEAYRESGYQFEVSVVRFGTVMQQDEILSIFRAKSVKNFLNNNARNPSNNTYRADVKDPAAKVRDFPDDMMLIPYGPDGRSWRIHLTHATDAAEGVILALITPEASGEAFNILSRTSTVREQAVKYIAEKTGYEYREVHLDTFWEFECSIEKAERILGYNPAFDTIKMIDDAIEWRKKGYHTVHKLNSTEL